MPRIAFNDAKETVHTVSWPLKGLYSSTGKKKKATAVLAASFPPKGGPGDCLPPSQGGLSLTLPHQGCWKRPVTEPPRSSRKKVSGEDLSGEKGTHAGTTSAGKPSPGGASRTLHGSHLTVSPNSVSLLPTKSVAPKCFLSSNHYQSGNCQQNLFCGQYSKLLR